MARKLAGYVHVTDPDTGASAVFGPGDDVPAWAEQVITNPKAWSEEEQATAAVMLDKSVEYQPETEPGESRASEDGTADYEAMTVADLKSEIRARNDGRDETDQLSTDGVKADLIAALVADDRAASA